MLNQPLILVLNYVVVVLNIFEQDTDTVDTVDTVDNFYFENLFIHI